MKKQRLILGIVSFVIAGFVLMQSAIVGLGNTLAGEGEIGGTGGFILSICAIVAGIIAIVTRESDGKGPKIAGGIYLAGAGFGFLSAGSYSDLYIWAVLFAIFGVLMIRSAKIEDEEDEDEEDEDGEYGEDGE